MGKELPKIVETLTEFFQYWQNPDKVEGDSFPIKEFQLRVYDVSSNFIFKWYVTHNELMEVSKFTDIEIINNQLELALGEYQIELAVSPN